MPKEDEMKVSMVSKLLKSLTDLVIVYVRLSPRA